MSSTSFLPQGQGRLGRWPGTSGSTRRQTRVARRLSVVAVLEQKEPPNYSRADWALGYKSQPREFSYEVTDIEGVLPRELSGSYFRNGPALFEAGSERFAHPFDGDGQLVSIAIRDGRAFFRSAFVKTPGYEAERKAGRILYRNTFGTQRAGGPLSNAFDITQKHVANTNLIVFGGKCLALWEALQPYAVDVKTLETVGLDTLNGTLKLGMPFTTGNKALDLAASSAGLPFGGDNFTAHPHPDPATKRLIAFGYKASVGDNGNTTFSIYEFDSAFALASKREYAMTGFAFCHDFSFTENYYIFFQNPVSMPETLPFLLGFKTAGQCLKWNGSQPTRVHVIPRPGTAAAGTSPMVFDLPACFVFHHANAYEKEGRIVVDSAVLPSLVDFEAVSGGPGGSFLDVDFDSVPINTLWRHTLDLNTGVASAYEHSRRVIEFPRISPIRFGKQHRYVYTGAARHETRNQPLQGWAKYDTSTEDGGKMTMWDMGPRLFAGEPEFIPRSGAIAASAAGRDSDDGWLCGLVFDASRNLSAFVIVDAMNMEGGPVATLWLKHHLPYGLHGNWVDKFHGPGSE